MPDSLIKKLHNKPKMPQLLSIWIFERVSEFSSDTTILYRSLFQAAGVEISIQDIDIGDHTPTRRATPGPRLVVCRITRRIAEERL